MRLLVACRACRRTYDASRLSPGQRFRCLCGEQVKVGQPRGHEARVVCCSSCGAPREKQSSRCGHCGGDFTLHEQDLDTVCPQCLARVSDRAKYCHYCGQSLAATLVAGEKAELQCPSCEGAPPLTSRKLPAQSLAMLECDRCAGLWLDAAMFEDLVNGAQARQWPQVLGAAAVEPARKAMPGPAGASGSRAAGARHGAEPLPRERWRYRNCPVCRKTMQRRNYERQSGIIIDTCRDHGLWLDADELPQIIAWVRGGGLTRARRRLEESQRFAQNTREIVRAAQSGDEDGDNPLWLGRTKANAASVIADVLSSIFRW